MSRGLSNKNPLNIRKSAVVYKGEVVSTDNAFKQFLSMAYGYRAAFMCLYTYQFKYGLNTIRKLISRWAPGNENNTSAYINTVSTRSGIPADAIISKEDKTVMSKIVSAMSFVENGVPAIEVDVEAGWELFISSKK